MGIRVGFDASAAIEGAGVGRYTVSLLRSLLTQAVDEEYVLLLSRDAANDEVVRQLVARRSILPVSRHTSEVLWQRLRLPVVVEWFTGRLDVFHSPNYLLPPLRSARSVVTIHDLSFLKLPQYAHPRLAAYLRGAVPRSIRRAEVILADSQSTADDVIELLRISPKRVRVVYPGVEPRFSPQVEEGEAERLTERYSLQRPYLLGVGTIEPRKNYRAMIEAFVSAHDRCGFTGELVIAGGIGWLAEDALLAAKQAGERVRLLGRFPEQDLPALYRQALALVYASHYEGFGFPPLEAMACGTPVLVSRCSSLPEVVGEAGLYCQTDKESIAKAMTELLRDDDLRARLRAAGIEQAKRFSWEKTAQQVRQLYHEVA